MIGHWLLTLTPEQEERVLTQPMQAGDYGMRQDGRCLVGTALTPPLAFCSAGNRGAFLRYWPWGGTSVEKRYDMLCARFGVRVNAAIRARILANQTRRALRRPYVQRTKQPT